MVTSFHAGWLFGPATAGSDQPGFDDSGLETITLPHTVTPLSWGNWAPASWEAVWVSHKHFPPPRLPGGVAVTSQCPYLQSPLAPR